MDKLKSFTDPACMAHDGVDRIRWVECDASVSFPRRSGKAMCKHDYYRKALAVSSTLAGFLELTSVGQSDSPITSVSSGQKLPINFGVDKTFVFPTSNRAAVDRDIGHLHAIVVGSDGTQYVNMSATNPGILTITEVCDEAGSFVAVRIPESVRFGNL